MRLARNAIRHAVMVSDLLGTSPASPLAVHGADVRLGAFRHVVAGALAQNLQNEWAAVYVRSAWAKGLADAGAPGSAPSAVMETLLNHELEGVAAATTAALVRVGARYHSSRSRAWQMAAAVYDQELPKRLQALIDTLTVRAYNRAKIEGYRSRGHTQVGILPEALPRAHVSDAWERSEAGNWVFRRSRRAAGRLAAEFEGELVAAQTAGDDRVCFPAWTLIDTDRGKKPIQLVKVGDRVLTRAGFRIVTRTVSRQYLGKLLLVVCDHAAFVCTAAHPVWCARFGFVQAVDLHSGDRLQLADKQLANVVGIYDLGFVDVQNLPTGLAQRAVSTLTLALIAMPPSAVDFNGYFIGQYEVKDVSTCFDFLLERYAQAFQGQPDDCFQSRFAFESAITSKRAEPRIERRLFAKLFSALTAVEYMRWASAVLRTVRANDATGKIGVSLNNWLATAKARVFIVAYMLLFAVPRAEVISIGDAALHSKRRVASNANLFDFVSSTSFVAMARAVRSTWVPKQTSWRRRVAAGFARLPQMLAWRHGVTVYNLTVAEMPEYYANGVLVHNCDVCDDIAADAPYDLDAAMDLLPAHIGCRCSIVEWTGEEVADATPPKVLLAAVQDAYDPDEPRDEHGRWSSGEKVTVYHGSLGGNYTPGAGHHFGPHEAATFRVKELMEMDPSSRPILTPSDPVVSMHKAELTLGKTYTMEDLGEWWPSDMAQQFHAQGTMATAELRALEAKEFSNFDPYEYLRGKGYDTIVYKNSWEGGGSSYIPLRGENVKLLAHTRDAFDPDQERDEHGRWTRGSGGLGLPPKTETDPKQQWAHNIRRTLHRQIELALTVGGGALGASLGGIVGGMLGSAVGAITATQVNKLLSILERRDLTHEQAIRAVAKELGIPLKDQLTDAEVEDCYQGTRQVLRDALLVLDGLDDEEL